MLSVSLCIVLIMAGQLSFIYCEDNYSSVCIVSSFWLDDDRASFAAKFNDVSLPYSDQPCCKFHKPYPVGAESSARKLGVRNGPLICCLVSRLRISNVKSSIVPIGGRDFSFSEMSRRLWGPSSLPFSGYWGSFAEVKRAGPDVEQ